MAAAAPARASRTAQLRRIAADVRTELRLRGRYPPGDMSFSAGRTHRMATDPLPVLLSCYERYGPVFSVRILHGTQVFVLGPEANHHLLVSNAANFRWREGGFGELEPLLGDGPADHRRRLPPARAPDHAARLPP